MQSSGNNWALQVYNPYPNIIKNVPRLINIRRIQVKLMMKDLGLSQNLAKVQDLKFQWEIWQRSYIRNIHSMETRS